MKKKYIFTTSKIIYDRMEAVIEANSYNEALKIAQDDCRYENIWEETGNGESENLDSNNIFCKNEKGEKINNEKEKINNI